ncbi:hypothetical protein [Asticcacaulis sp. YBE204]|uniref:hypothetical protein n=1 Tax=Asticcacaulis sp. YBE204 TaxID=1282363 RepID=UPI0003C3BCDE|nr:hypothetical protein [Asticcacaulis sp. YBE204]ESQ80567.1 hypothetical protein AEYBE204_04675 [Asticcacaulis sp. YBE204]
MPIRPLLSGTLLEARAWNRSGGVQTRVKPRHALSISLWTGLMVTALATVVIATQVTGGDMPEDAQPHAYADPRNLYPDTSEVVREKLDVRPVLPIQAQNTGTFGYAFAPSAFEVPAYRPVADTWVEPSNTYSEPTAPRGDKAVYLASDKPSSGVMICTDVCRNAESEARDTVEPLPEAAPIISNDKAPVVPASEGAPVIIETPTED